MPINREKELLFIHVPKTGGTKIEEILGMKYAGDNPDVSGEKLYGLVRINPHGSLLLDGSVAPHDELYELQHLTHKQILDYKFVDKNLFDRCYKFAFVRNPFDKVVSEFFWLGYKYFSRFEYFVEFLYKNKAAGNNPSATWGPDVRNSDYFDSSFDWFLTYCHYKSQHEFICDEKGNLIIDFLGRFEDFQEDLSTLLDYLVEANRIEEYDKESLFQKVNSTSHKKYTAYYNAKTKNMIKSIYKRDFEIFGYE